MATKAQITANRKNAKKSTGPKTDKGKAAASKNALKHGFFSIDAVVRDEDQADFDLYRQQMLDEMKPAGVMETTLAERIVNLAWRLRRAERMQDQALKMQLRTDMLDLVVRQVRWSYRDANGLPQEESYPKNDHMTLGRAARNDIANYRILEKLLMYERRIESSMLRMIKELRQLQSERKAGQTCAAEEQPAPESPPAKRQSGDLKKRSQFVAAQSGAMAVGAKYYVDKPPAGVPENEANQTCPERGRKSQFQRFIAAVDGGKVCGETHRCSGSP